jgi:hypothetical protein
VNSSEALINRWGSQLQDDAGDPRLLYTGAFSSEYYLQFTVTHHATTVVSYYRYIHQPPETIFAEPFDRRVDLWWDAPPILQKVDINTRRFIHSSLEQFGGDVSLVAQMICLLGKLGKKWQPKSERMRLNLEFKSKRFKGLGRKKKSELKTCPRYTPH